MRSNDKLIREKCPACRAEITLGRSSLNKRIQCPRCFRFSPVPPASGNLTSEWPQIYPPEIISVEIKFPCPDCGSKLEIDARLAGARVCCPVCTNKIRAPHLASLIMPPLSTAMAATGSSLPKPVARLSPQEIDFLRNIIW